jgi:hypothetical protein
MKNKYLKLSTLFFLGFRLVVNASTYYVAKNGSDDYAGTEALPWKTIQKAANTVVAGDTVYIKTGTYNERVIPANSGSSGSPIIYAPYESDEVIIDATGLSGSAVYINGKSYIIFGGPSSSNKIQIKNAMSSGSAGVMLNGAATHCILRNLYIENTDMGGIHAMSDWFPVTPILTNLTIDGCEITNTNHGYNQEALSLIMVDQFEIKNCKIHNTVKEGIDMKQGCSNGEIHDNECYNVHPGIYLDFRGLTHNIKIYNNNIHHNGDGIAITDEEGTYTGEDIYIYNNLIYHNTSRGINFYNYGGKYTRVNIVNNTLYHNYIEIGLFEDAANFTDCVIANNIIVGTTYDLITFPSGPSPNVFIDHNLFYADSYMENSIYGTNYIYDKDPSFADPSDFDFHLQSNSPAINAGSSANAPDLDFDGNPRPQGEGYDIGAYEDSSYQITKLSKLSNIESQVERIVLYPNPVKSVLNIFVPTDKEIRYSLEVFNTNGSIIYSLKDMGTGQYQLDMSGYPAGVYLLKFNNNKNQQVIEKIIKQ